MAQRHGRLVRLLGQPAFPLLLGPVGLGLLLWPMLTEPPRSPLVLYGYQFVVWALLIGVLYAMARSQARRRPPGPGGGPDG